MATKKGKTPVGPVVYTANRLDDGRVVFLGRNLTWVESLAQAEVMTGDRITAGLAEAQADERRQIVVAVYAVDVAEGPEIVPLKQRERIRAAGPSIVETGAARNAS